MIDLIVKKNFLEPDLFNDLIYYAISQWESKTVTFKTNQHWMKEIVKDSNIILSHDIPNIDLKDRLVDAIRKSFNVHSADELMLYYYNPGSHIPWHDDYHCKGAFTIYLNDDWDRDYGGLYLYDRGEGIQGLVPEKNMIVFQPGGLPHAVSVLSPRAPVRVTVQAFFDKEKAKQ